MQQQQYFFFKKGAAIRITCNISSGVEDLNRVQRKQNVFCLDANLFPDADQQKCRPLWLWQLPELIFSGDSYQSLLDPFARWEQRSWKPASLWMQPGLFYFLFFFFFLNTFTHTEAHLPLLGPLVNLRRASCSLPLAAWHFTFSELRTAECQLQTLFLQFP